MSGFVVPAILSSYSPKADNSMGLRFSTQELPEDDRIKVMKFYNQFGWLVFDITESALTQVPDEPPVKEGKSPSQRLRAVMFVYWKQQGIEEPFNQYWERWNEKQIDAVKDKLDEAL